MGQLAFSACVLLVALRMLPFVESKGSSCTGVLGIHEHLHFYGPILPVCFRGWPASGSVVVVVAGGGPKPPLRELSPVLACHVRPCGELRIWDAPTGDMTVSEVLKCIEMTVIT